MSEDTSMICERCRTVVQEGGGHLWCSHVDIERGDDVPAEWAEMSGAGGE